PVVDRRGQGGGRGDPRAEQEADRHGVPGADLRCVRGGPDGGAEPGGQLQGDLRRVQGPVRGCAQGRARLHRGQGGGHRLPRRPPHLDLRRRSRHRTGQHLRQAGELVRQRVGLLEQGAGDVPRGRQPL
ncbi:MAG: NAD-dependent glyceraldehyde-3-phosphate dehydrogenase, partial [uncultured Ramlibacter sp.]